MKRANGVGADAGQSVPRSPVVRRSTGPTPRASVSLLSPRTCPAACSALVQTPTKQEGRRRSAKAEAEISGDKSTAIPLRVLAGADPCTRTACASPPDPRRTHSSTTLSLTTRPTPSWRWHPLVRVVARAWAAAPSLSRSTAVVGDAGSALLREAPLATAVGFGAVLPMARHLQAAARRIARVAALRILRRLSRTLRSQEHQYGDK